MCPEKNDSLWILNLYKINSFNTHWAGCVLSSPGIAKSQATETAAPICPSSLVLWNQPQWRMVLHLDSCPSSGHSWNSLSLWHMCTLRTLVQLGHLSGRPEPSSALKLAIAKASSSPKGTWSHRLADQLSPASKQPLGRSSVQQQGERGALHNG